MAENSSHATDIVCPPDAIANLTYKHDVAESFGYTRSELIYTAVFLPVLSLIGIVANGAFLFVVHRVPTMKTITNVYLVNVAIADILFLATIVTFKIIKLATSVVVSDVSGLGAALCIILFTIANVMRFASLGFISAVTWERFCAVCRPHSRRSTSTYAIIVSITIWTIAFVLSATIIPAYGKYITVCMIWPKTEKFADWPSEILVVGQVAPWASMYSNVVQTFPFFITFVINIYFYVRIIRGLDAAMMSRTWDGRRSEYDTALRGQTVRMLVVNGVAYFLCLALFQFLSLYKTIIILTKLQPVMTPRQGKILLDVARTLEYMNSVINPVIYTVMSRRYKEAFKTAFRWKQRTTKASRSRTLSNSTPVTTTQFLSRNRNTSL
ncbi:somatostatin receptor type 5-like [Strongylocentrotus purpuratus]|uniref:G-protein coupled receptors family 1 profile domain-containing protein n=1 Tax=Strongylocentrotus purpuratus TaxID=7668 RepID=A0A7M7N5L2_STRPU|nr:somatostatin receptor type 5-like [Strongylocentrotus purpuratus]